MKITWFGHSCFRIDTGASSILIDPFLTFNQTFENAGIPLHQATKGVTHVALTHGHEDHTGDTVAICKETGAPLARRARARHLLAGQGVERSIRAIPAARSITRTSISPSSRPGIRPRSMVDGRPALSRRLLRARHRPKEGKTVYHMGDTAIFSDMALIGEIYAPKIGFVPIGDRYTMGAARRRRSPASASSSSRRSCPAITGLSRCSIRPADKFVAEMGGSRAGAQVGRSVRGVSRGYPPSQVAAWAARC